MTDAQLQTMIAAGFSPAQIAQVASAEQAQAPEEPTSAEDLATAAVPDAQPDAQPAGAYIDITVDSAVFGKKKHADGTLGEPYLMVMGKTPEGVAVSGTISFSKTKIGSLMANPSKCTSPWKNQPIAAKSRALCEDAGINLRDLTSAKDKTLRGILDPKNPRLVETFVGRKVNDEDAQSEANEFLDELDALAAAEA